MMKSFIVIPMVLALFTGCSTTFSSSVEEKNIAYIAYVKAQELESVDRIRSFRFNGWQTLTNKYLIMSSSPKKKYLIELKSNCSELSFAHGILLNQSTSSVLSTRFDSISLVETPYMKCFIKEIHIVTKAQAKELSAIGKATQD